jgi:hypothetical protein
MQQTSLDFELPFKRNEVQSTLIIVELLYCKQRKKELLQANLQGAILTIIN